MGSPKDEDGRSDNEGPVNKVTIHKSFELGTYLVTQREWKAVMGSNPSEFKGDDLPVENVSWNDVQKFIGRLNDRESTDKYRLPFEAEWEYTCRAGRTTRYSFGDDELMLGEYAWYDGNSGGKTHPVGQKKPNPWGLYDMHGNVWELVQDRYGDYRGATTDERWGNMGGSDRVIRGGGWADGAHGCRSAARYFRGPGDHNYVLSFRLLRKL